MKLRTERILAWTCLLAATPALFAQAKQFRVPVAAGATVTISNQYGPVTLRASSGKEVVVSAKPQSNKVEVDENHTANRVDLVSHLQPGANATDGRVEYDVQVPAGATVSVHAPTGPIRVAQASGDLTLDSDAGDVEVRDSANSHVHVHTLKGAITLVNLKGAHVDATTVGGNITLTNVSGPKLTADSNTGAIQFTGDCAGGGDYALSTHSGDINVAMPASASVELNARSVNGAVQNDFPFQPLTHAASQQAQGRSYVGRANSAASLLQLRSFSGTIRVKKQ